MLPLQVEELLEFVPAVGVRKGRQIRLEICGGLALGVHQNWQQVVQGDEIQGGEGNRIRSQIRDRDALASKEFRERSDGAALLLDQRLELSQRGLLLRVGPGERVADILQERAALPPQ